MSPVCVLGYRCDRHKWQGIINMWESEGKRSVMKIWHSLPYMTVLTTNCAASHLQMNKKFKLSVSLVASQASLYFLPMALARSFSSRTRSISLSNRLLKSCGADTGVWMCGRFFLHKDNIHGALTNEYKKRPTSTKFLYPPWQTMVMIILCIHKSPWFRPLCICFAFQRIVFVLILYCTPSHK